MSREAAGPGKSGMPIRRLYFVACLDKIVGILALIMETRWDRECRPSITAEEEIGKPKTRA